MTKAYSSNLTYDQFKLIEPLLPAAKPGGRPRSVCLWSILNGIFYVVVNSCKWRDLPGDLPPWQTVYTYFRNWRTDGTWQAIHQRLRGWTRAVAGRAESPSEGLAGASTRKPTVMNRGTEIGLNRFPMVPWKP